jgi:hypothetical protein
VNNYNLFVNKSFLTPSECFRNAKKEAASFNTTPPIRVTINPLLRQQDTHALNPNHNLNLIFSSFFSRIKTNPIYTNNSLFNQGINLFNIYQPPGYVSNPREVQEEEK